MAGVLVAISIPIFTAQLEKSREAVDLANLRACKSAAVSEYLVGNKSDTNVTWTDADDPSKGFTAYYDAQNGVLKASSAGQKYGKGTKTDGGNADAGLGYTATTEASGKDIKVVVDDKGACTFTWEE